MKLNLVLRFENAQYTEQDIHYHSVIKFQIL